MKIFYIGLHYNVPEPRGVELVREYELSNYSRFTKGSVAEIMSFGAGTIAKNAVVGRIKVEEDTYMAHVLRRQMPGDLVAVMLADPEYPELAAQATLAKIFDEFSSKYPVSVYRQARANELTYPELAMHIKKYQDPANSDPTLKIQQELAETKVTLYKTIESVLERGEKIDNLVAKSDGLSAQSKMFYTQAKKQNSCCSVM